MKMVRKHTYSGSVAEKDEQDIFYWAFEKTAAERLQESWRLHCMNHGAKPHELRLDKTKSRSYKRNE